MTIRLNLPEKLTVRLVRMIFLSIPNVISHSVKADLGTQKLEEQLKNDNLASSITELFLQKGLVADLKLSEYLIELERLRKRIENSEFFVEAFLVKLRDIYIRYGLSKEDEPGFARLVAEVAADALSLKGKERSDHISRVLQELQQKRALSRLSSA